MSTRLATASRNRSLSALMLAGDVTSVTSPPLSPRLARTLGHIGGELCQVDQLPAKGHVLIRMSESTQGMSILLCAPPPHAVLHGLTAGGAVARRMIERWS